CPSGDQRGLVSCLPLVMRTGASFPEVATVQIEVSYPVRFSSTTTRVNATRAPSGESCGLAIQVNLKRSFSVTGRLPELVGPAAFCPAGGEAEIWARNEFAMNMSAIAAAEGRKRMHVLGEM